MISGVTWYSEDQVFFYSLTPLFPCTRLHLLDCELTGFDEEEIMDGDINLTCSSAGQVTPSPCDLSLKLSLNFRLNFQIAGIY